MNNAENFPVDIEEQREWLLAEKGRRNVAWTVIGPLCGVPAGTLSNFANATYQGRNDAVARLVYKWRQTLASQEDRQHGLVVAPGYFETRTSRIIHSLLIEAHSGRITVGATGPGTGKTVTMAEYRSSAANVWTMTMRPSIKRLNGMLVELLRAIGVPAKVANGTSLSRMLIDQVRSKRGLIIIDEANHASVEQLEELRSIHDETQVGLCLLGNEELLMRIEGGQRKDAFARLNSRIAQRLIQTRPEMEDVQAFCEAWGLPDPGMRDLLSRVALMPGAGGLRECRQIVEQASLLAAGDNRPLELSDLKDALSNRATRLIGA